jgi:hypothetical protein
LLIPVFTQEKMSRGGVEALRAHEADEDGRGRWPWALPSQDTDFATTLANLRAAIGEQQLRDRERTTRFWANARDHTETVLDTADHVRKSAVSAAADVVTRLHISPTARRASHEAAKREMLELRSFVGCTLPRRRAQAGENEAGEGEAKHELLAFHTLIAKLQREGERWEREVTRLEAVARRSTASVNCVAGRGPPLAGRLATCAAARKKAGAHGELAESISKAEQGILVARQRATTMFQNSCVDCYLWTRAPPQAPILRIVALGEPIDSDTVTAVLAATEQLLDEGRHFHTSWDLRRLPKPPALSLAVRTVNWGIRHMDRLEVFNRRLTILMPGNMAALQNIVLWMLAALKPSCPIYLGVDGAAAAYFEQELAAP